MNCVHSTDALDPIAIVGLACRFPGVSNPVDLWRCLAGLKPLARTFTEKELRTSGTPPALLNHPDYIKVGTLLSHLDQFDAGFFGITPADARLMDPQHRLFLECAWEAFENAGCVPSQQAGPVGVFAATCANLYLHRNLMSHPDLRDQVGDLSLQLTNGDDFLAARIAYHLDLKGPAMVVKSACSSGLVAVHNACQNLLSYTCDVALAGAAAVQDLEPGGYVYREGGLKSPDGKTRSFDGAAAGTIRGNGLAVFVLKRLDEAIDEGDPIQGVILSSTVNNDGAARVGFAAPGATGQADVIAEALDLAAVHPDTIGLVEGFGSATPIGDAIEVQALTRAFRRHTSRTGKIPLGSVKTHVGHLNAAAGAAGLLKAILALGHGQIPPNLHFENPNPSSGLEESPFYVNSQLQAWPDTDVRRAAVNAYGIGGTNAHVILEEAPQLTASGPGRSLQLLVISGRNDSSLLQIKANLAEALTKEPELSLADVAYTLHLGRCHFATRCFLLASQSTEAGRLLRQVSPMNTCGDEIELVMVIPEIADPEATMSAFADETEFSDGFGECRRLAASMGVLLDPGAGVWIEDTEVGTIARFAVAYAQGKLWLSWGLQPKGLIGFGHNELVAACLAGVLQLEQALVLALKKPCDQSFSGSATTAFFNNGNGSWQGVSQANPTYWDNWLPSYPEHWSLPSGVGHTLVLGPNPNNQGPAGGTRSYVKEPSLEAALSTLGQLWLVGVAVDWQAFYTGQKRRKLCLPTYAFQRERHWIDRIDSKFVEVSASTKNRQPTASRPDLQQAWRAPTSRLEKDITTIWQDLFAMTSIGVDDHFLDLGGDSLLAIRLIRMLGDQLHIPIPMKSILENPTVSTLAKALEQMAKKPSDQPKLETSRMDLTF